MKIIGLISTIIVAILINATSINANDILDDINEIKRTGSPYDQAMSELGTFTPEAQRALFPHLGTPPSQLSGMGTTPQHIGGIVPGYGDSKHDSKMNWSEVINDDSGRSLNDSRREIAKKDKNDISVEFIVIMIISILIFLLFIIFAKGDNE